MRCGRLADPGWDRTRCTLARRPRSARDRLLVRETLVALQSQVAAMAASQGDLLQSQTTILASVAQTLALLRPASHSSSAPTGSAPLEPRSSN
jgi:hypothetical protein